MGTLTVVVGAQYGSEGKGAIVGYLAKELDSSDTVIRVAGPNAGHTAYDPDGREWKLRAVPVAAATNTECQLHIAAGSEIDLGVLLGEIEALEAAGHKVAERLTIHPSATILESHHIYRESADGIVGRVGSTGKGIGAARADRIWRKATTFGELAREYEVTGTVFERPRIDALVKLVSQPGPFQLTDRGDVIIEGTQGYGLGLHTTNYPQVTSSDCRAIDFLAMAGISPWDDKIHDLKITLVARVFPIRVAGNSGPLQGETSWNDLGLPEERTTVTNKVRRVGAWDEALVKEAIRANGGGSWGPHVEIALTMLDQLHPEMRDETELLPASEAYITELENTLCTPISFVGTGPDTVIER